MTYLDPVLVQYVVLSNTFLSANYLQRDEFDKQLSEVMGELSKRNELLFVVTITAPSYQEQAYNGNVLTVKLPIRELTLVGSAGQEISHAHADHILDQTLDITHGPISGFVGYPISVLNQGNCTWLMDQSTTTLTLELPYVVLGETRFGAQFWTISYYPLLLQDDAHPITSVNAPVSVVDPYYNWDRVQTLTQPPTPNWIPNAVTDNTDWKTWVVFSGIC